MPDYLTGEFAPCAQHLSRVDGSLLDCVSDDIALLLAGAGVDDLRSVFGRDWRFELRTSDSELPQLDLPPAEQDDLVAQRTGYHLRWVPVTAAGTSEAQWRGALHAGHPVLVVADAYFLPWLPYHGHQHLDHGFVIEGIEDAPDSFDPDSFPVAHIVDPYDNTTEWGRAEPTLVRLPLAELTPALAQGRWATLAPVTDRGTTPLPDPDQQVAINAKAVLRAAERGSYAEFIDRHRSLDLRALDNLTLQTWLLARDRGLHSRWLSEQPGDTGAARLGERFDTEIAEGWRRAAQACYLAMRRVRAGRRAPASAIATVESVIAKETALAGSLLSDDPGGHQERETAC